MIIIGHGQARDMAYVFCIMEQHATRVMNISTYAIETLTFTYPNNSEVFRSVGKIKGCYRTCSLPEEIFVFYNNFILES